MSENISRTTKAQPVFIGQVNRQKHQVDDQQPYTQYQTWLAETSGMLGCPINCQYCFFQVDGFTPVQPKVGLTPREMVDKLGEQLTYMPEMPVHFGSKTDAFSTKQTIDYYTQVLQYYGESAYPNPLVFITKRSIPDEIMTLVSRMKQPVLFYLSFSALGGTAIEPTVKSEIIKENFVRLKEKGLLAVHYWRPFLPQNSTQKMISAMMDFVSQYALCSVVNGLRLSEGIREHMIPFWPELKECQVDILTSGEFWPEGVRDYLISYTREQHPSYPIFFGNTPCSIAYVLKQPDVYGHFNGAACKESNCPQRAVCEANHRIPTLTQIKQVAASMGIAANMVTLHDQLVRVKGSVASGKLTYMRYALKFPVLSDGIDYSAGYNWANIREEGRIVEVPWRDNWTVKRS